MSVFKKSSIFIIFIVVTSLSVSCSIKSDNNNSEVPAPEELYSEINNLQNNSPSVEDSPTKKESVFFSGNWNRTEIIRAGASSLKITNETSNSFDFELDVFHGDHFGVLSGTAIKDTPRKAEFIIEAAEGYHNGGALKFVIDEEDKNLNLSLEGDIVALDFGQNVVPDGDYVLGKPYYVSDNYPSLVFGSERVQNKIRRLMTETNENRDDTAYRMLLEVMKEGLPELVESGRYKGFIGSGHEMGVDLYISPEEEICIMAYGLEEGQYVFYTSEIIYHGWMTYPEYLVIPDWIPREEISFEYCGYYEESAEEPVVSESTLEGERHEAENFTVIAPEGWQVTELYGGLQIARSGAELIRISFTGFNQAADHAKQQVEHMSKSNSDSKVEEIEILGKTFWATIYKTASGSERGYYARIEDGGVMLKIETVNGGYKTHKEFTGIIDSIVFK